MITRKKAIFKLGALFASSTISLNFCSRGRSWKNKESINYSVLILEIADIIIPQTNTPGAKDVGVHIYIVNVIESCLSDRDKRTLLTGLDEVDEYTMKKYSSLFAKCTKEKKISALEHFKDRGSLDSKFLSKVKNKLLGPSFFELIKTLTVQAYCSSEVGATQGLAYEHLPIEYVACTSLRHNQRSWATA